MSGNSGNIHELVSEDGETFTCEICGAMYQWRGTYAITVKDGDNSASHSRDKWDEDNNFSWLNVLFGIGRKGSQ